MFVSVDRREGEERIRLRTEFLRLRRLHWQMNSEIIQIKPTDMIGDCSPVESVGVGGSVLFVDILLLPPILYWWPGLIISFDFHRVAGINKRAFRLANQLRKSTGRNGRRSKNSTEIVDLERCSLTNSSAVHLSSLKQNIDRFHLLRPCSRSLRVYRARVTHINALRLMKQPVGTVISMNSFLPSFDALEQVFADRT